MRMSCSGRLVLVLVFTAILTDVRFRFLVHQGLCGKQRDREAGVPASSDSVDVPIGRDGLRPPGKVNAPRPVGVAPIKSLADPSEVCIFLTGELFRSGRKGDRQKLSLDDDWVVSEQKRASQSQVENLLQPLQERLGAKLRLYLDTWDKSGEEEFVELVRSFYRPFEITKFVARKWVQEGKAVRDSVGGTRTPEAPENNKQSQSSSAPAESGGGSSSPKKKLPVSLTLAGDRIGKHVLVPWFLDPTRVFLKDYADVGSCGGGLLWSRPDIVWKTAMRDILLTVQDGWFAKNTSENSAVSTSTQSSLQRWSFIENRTVPLDLRKLLFLGPVWRSGDYISGPREEGGGRWRIVDVFTWIPGWMLPGWYAGPDVRTPLGESFDPEADRLAYKDAPSGPTHCKDATLPRTLLFRNHQVFAFLPNCTKWVQKNIGWVVLNSQHDADTANDWNPTFRIAARLPARGYVDEKHKPSLAVEQHLRNMGRGFSREGEQEVSRGSAEDRVGEG